MSTIPHKSLKRHLSETRAALPLTLLALPGIAMFFVFNYLPLYGLLLPFKNYRANLGLWGSQWVGLSNFSFLFRSDALFRITRNTILYNLAFIFIGTFCSLTIALLLFELSRRSVKIYQTALFVPYFVSWVVVSYALQAMLNMDSGMFNKILAAFGREPVLWYNTPAVWPPIILVVAVWKGLGYGSVIYYAALMGVDATYYEAASIDGASKLRQVFSISLPSISGVIVMMFILQVGKIFYGDFGLFYSVPLNSSMLYPTTDVIDTFVYRALVSSGDIGMASAAGFYQSIVGFVMVLSANAIIRKFSEENALF